MKKRCKKCGKVKTCEDFYRHKGMKSGYLNTCKVCISAIYKEYRNDEEWLKKKKEYSRKYYEENSKKLVSRSKKWVADNREKARAYKRKYMKKLRSIPEHRYKMDCRDKLHNAIRYGKITKQNVCENCGIECVTDCHHSDYSEPLHFIELCKQCHINLHNNNIIYKLCFQHNLQ